MALTALTAQRRGCGTDGAALTAQVLERLPARRGQRESAGSDPPIQDPAHHTHATASPEPVAPGRHEDGTVNVPDLRGPASVTAMPPHLVATPGGISGASQRRPWWVPAEDIAGTLCVHTEACQRPTSPATGRGPPLQFSPALRHGPHQRRDQVPRSSKAHGRSGRQPAAPRAPGTISPTEMPLARSGSVRIPRAPVRPPPRH